MSENNQIRPMPVMTERLINRFWSKVAITAQENKCWEWQAHLSEKGYGTLSVTVSTNRDLPFAAHRLSYYFNNKVDPKDLLVCHECDNPKCVNPKHLFLGTPLDNMTDMISKQRDIRLCGENAPWSKLKDNDVLNIRKMYAEGTLQKNLAALYNIDQGAISNIIRRKNWKHV